MDWSAFIATLLPGQRKADLRARQGRRAEEKRLNRFPPITPFTRKMVPNSRVYSAATIERYRLEIEAHPTPNGIDFFKVTSDPVELLTELFSNKAVEEYIKENGIEVPITLVNGINDPVNFDPVVKPDMQKGRGGYLVYDNGKTVRLDLVQFKEVFAKINMNTLFQFNLRSTHKELNEWLFDILIEADEKNTDKYIALRDEFFIEYVAKPVREMISRLSEYTLSSALNPAFIQRVLENGLDDSVRDNIKNHFLTHKVSKVELKYLEEIQDTYKNILNPIGRFQFLVLEYSRIAGKYVVLKDSEKRDGLLRRIRQGKNSYASSNGCEEALGVSTKIPYEIIDRDPILPFQ